MVDSAVTPREKRSNRSKISKRFDVWVFTVSAIGVLVLVNVVFTRFPQSLDLTSNKINSLSPQTIGILGRLKEPVNIFAFVDTVRSDLQQDARQIGDVLELYKRFSHMIHVEVIDLRARPAMANEMGVTQINSVVMVMGEKKKLVPPQHIFSKEAGGRRIFLGEQYLTSGFLSLLEDQQRVIYFTEGHGELLLEGNRERGASYAKSTLESENRIVKQVNLAKIEKKKRPVTAPYIARMT